MIKGRMRRGKWEATQAKANRGWVGVKTEPVLFRESHLFQIFQKSPGDYLIFPY